MGKVHGSLSRAGKVKNATKRPEKKPKKHQKVGRARKRLLYVKRYVHVELGPNGQVKRPNQQPAGKLG